MSFPTAAEAPQSDLFGTLEPPVIAAWGAGVDSTAMLIELVDRGERVDAALFADVGDEHPETYAFIEQFRPWLEEHGVPVHVVRYQPRDFKHYPAYRSLSEDVLAHGVLPGVAMGGHSCAAKWKLQPQDRWIRDYEPARRIWAAGGKVVKLIGYDCSPADQRR